NSGAASPPAPTPTGLPEGTPSPPQQLAPDELPRTAGRYQLEGEISHGGMGVVFRGHDPDFNRTLAIKILREDHAGKPDLESRFLEEAQLTGQLQHPGIPPAHEIGRLPDGRPFFSMKLIKGQTLAALLRERQGPSEELPRFVTIYAQVCQTL